MRALPPALASHLASGVTTICRCWRLTRRDGVITGFTDHDRDLAFEGVNFAAASGLTPSDAESQLGLGVGGAEVSGALMGAALTEADIAAGRYDDAEVATYLVNWADVTQRLLLDVFSIGEIRRDDGHFVAELRSIAHRYDQPQGRLFAASCAADFGDARCKLPLAAFTVSGQAQAGATHLALSLAGLGAMPGGWATGGRATFTSGANAGLTRMIKLHAGTGIVFWEPLPAVPATGDTLSVVAGCDKTFETCLGRFANTDNFRGFPHIPTPDFVVSYARPGQGGYDGSRLDP